MLPGRIAIIRHAERIDLKNKSWKATAPRPHDSPITEVGHQMGRSLGAWFAQHSGSTTNSSNSCADAFDNGLLFNGTQASGGVHRIVIASSPLLRCVETSKAIADGIQHFVKEKCDSQHQQLEIVITLQNALVELDKWVKYDIREGNHMRSELHKASEKDPNAETAEVQVAPRSILQVPMPLILSPSHPHLNAAAGTYITHLHEPSLLGSIFYKYDELHKHNDVGRILTSDAESFIEIDHASLCETQTPEERAEMVAERILSGQFLSQVLRGALQDSTDLSTKIMENVTLLVVTHGGVGRYFYNALLPKEMPQSGDGCPGYTAFVLLKPSTSASLESSEKQNVQEANDLHSHTESTQLTRYVPLPHPPSYRGSLWGQPHLFPEGPMCGFNCGRPILMSDENIEALKQGEAQCSKCIEMRMRWRKQEEDEKKALQQ